MRSALALFAIAVAGAGSARAAGQPNSDLAFDCRMLPATHPRSAPNAGRGPAERSVWLLPGRVSGLSGDDARSRFLYEGPYDLFVSQGVRSSRIDWPRRVELGVSSALRDASVMDDFRLLRLDRSKTRARVALLRSERPNGLNTTFHVTRGYVGDCRILHGPDARRAYEALEG